MVAKYRIDQSGGAISIAHYSYDAAEGAAGKLMAIWDYAVNDTVEFWYNEYNQVKTILHTHMLRETLRCNIDYNEKLLIANETYSDSSGEFESIEYQYRSNLNYYSEVEKTLNSCFGRHLTTQNHWDNLNRLDSIVTLNEDTQNGMQIDIEYLARTGMYSNNTTTYIGEWKYRKKTGDTLTQTRKDNFEYDINGNITKYTITEGGSNAQIRYGYDSANRLIREDNERLNATYTYTYDTNGNIIKKRTYAYTAPGAMLPAPQKIYSYEYDSENADRLMNWDDKAFIYDACGNPTTYKDETMIWERGRLLKEYKGFEFHYNADGERTSKYSDSSSSTNYSIINGKLMQQDGSGYKIYFLHDAAGIMGFAYRDYFAEEITHYYYVKNLFGDVIELWRADDNTLVAKYVYDAWGNCKVYDYWCSDKSNDPDFIGNINPIRYRSYYWDSDVKLYYLHTRWYDPEIGRFINMDQLQYLDPTIINGLNLYAYCLNNPVMGYDPYGTFIWLIIGIAVGAAIGFGTTVAADYLDDGEVFNGSISWQTYVGATLIGAAIGGFTGGFGGEVLSFTVPTGLSWVTTGTTTALAVTSTVTVTVTVGEVIGAATAIGTLVYFAGKDPYVEYLKQGMSAYQQDEFKDLIEEYKLQHGRGGADNLSKSKNIFTL